MKKTLLAASVFAAFAAPAFAEGVFDGIYTGISMGAISNSANVQASQGGQQLISTDAGKAGLFGGQIFAGYSYSFDKFNLAANTFANFGQTSVATVASQGEPTQKLRLKNIWGIAVEPGFYLSDKTLGYAKLGFAKGKLNADGASKSANGFLYGAGIKHLVSSNVYVGAEFYKIDFRKISQTAQGITVSTNPTQTFGGLTLGYKF